MLGCQGNFRHTLDTATFSPAPHSLQQHTIHMTVESTSHIAGTDSHTQIVTTAKVCIRVQLLQEGGLLNVLWACFTDPPAGAERGLNMQCETCVDFFFLNLCVLCVVEESEMLS